MMTAKRLLPSAEISIALIVACALTCCLAWCGVAYLSEWLEEYPIPLADDQVMIDRGALSADSYEEWLQMARQLLSERGWGSFDNLTFLAGDTSCASPTSLTRTYFVFADVEFTTVMHHLKVASVSLPSWGVASVEIEDRGPVLRKQRAMDLSRVTVGLYEAVAIAEAHGGRALREQMGNECHIGFLLSDYEWSISYYDRAASDLPALTVHVNAKSGRVDIEH